MNHAVSSSRNADIVTALLVAVLAALWFLPTLHAALADADAYLQHISAVTGFDRQSLRDVYRALARHHRALQPGWFPLGPVPLGLWLADPPPFAVKVIQFALVVLTFGTFAIVTRRLFQSSSAAVFAAVTALALWQLRMPHDPVIGTSFVIPWLAEWVLLGYAAWLNYRLSANFVWLGFACVTIAVAMLSDPMGWALAAPLAVMALSDRDQRPAAFIVVATIVFVVGLSSVYGLPHAPWQRPGSYARDVFAQMIAPFPASYRSFGQVPIGRIAGFWHGTAFVDDRFITVPAVDALGWLRIVVCASTAFLALRAAQSSLKNHTLWRPLFFGLVFWFVPSIVLGPPAVWHGGLPLGQSFDVVYFQYFGIAALITAALCRLRQISVPAVLLAPSLSGVAVFLLCYGNVRADAVAIAQTARLESSRDVIERAAVAGFFRVLPEGATIAVSRSEPFANGIHSSISDAKYAIFHFSKRRFAVIGTDQLRRGFKSNAWILQTSRTSLIQVSLAHWAGNNGIELLADRAYGYSVAKDMRSSFEMPRRGLRMTVTRLSDGVSVEARRTCGPVPANTTFAAAVPYISWGAGFYERGPYGYSDGGNHDVMFMGPRASLVLRPTTCSPVPLTFSAVVTAGGVGTLVARFQNNTERVTVSNIARTFVIHVRRKSQPVEIALTTDAPAADFDPTYYRYEHDRPRDLRLTFRGPVVVEDLAGLTRTTRPEKQR